MILSNTRSGFHTGSAYTGNYNLKYNLTLGRGKVFELIL